MTINGKDTYSRYLVKRIFCENNLLTHIYPVPLRDHLILLSLIFRINKRNFFLIFLSNILILLLKGSLSLDLNRLGLSAY